jgi:HlyD family secretion protein
MSSPLIIEAAEANDTLVVALGKPSKALRLVYYVVLAFIAAAVLWAYFSVVDISVHADGVVRPQSGVHIVRSDQTAYIRRLYVEENRYVRAGDTIALFDAARLEEQIAARRAKKSLLLRELADVEALAALGEGARFSFPVFARERDIALQERDLLRRELQAAENKLRRVRDLWQKQFASREELEEAEIGVEQKKTALQNFLQSVRKNAFEREKQTLALIAEQDAALAELEIERGRAAVRAPVSGFITNLAVKSENALLTSGQTLCAIAPDEEVRVECFVSAADIGFLREGLRARYQMSALPFQEWGMAEGRVLLVSKDASLAAASERVGVEPNARQTQAAYFKVVGDISSPFLSSRRSEARSEQIRRARITTGMTCRAHIVVAQKRLLSMLWDKTIAYFSLG